LNLKKRFTISFILIVIVPFATMVLFAAIAWTSWNADIVISDELEAPRFLHDTILKILEEKTKELSIADAGIVFILDHEGNTIYAASEVVELYPNILERNSWDKYGQILYSRLMYNMPTTPFNITVFRYKGNSGMAVYLQKIVSKNANAVKISVKLILIFYLGFILIPFITLTFFMRPVALTFVALETAMIEVGKGNWDVVLPYTSPVPQKLRLSHLLESFEIMRQELKENNERQQRILMAVSHDLKTPLTSIKGYLEAIKDGMASNPEELNSYTNIIIEKTNLLEERISDLIHFSRIHTSEWKNWMTSINLKSLLQEMGVIFKNDALIRRRKIDVSLTIPEETQIKGDEKMLFQVLENLFDNACRYTDEKESLCFTAKVKDKVVFITIEDSGQGIGSEHVPYIFDTFYRADSGRNTRGIGVGLASAKTIIQYHGGKISYEKSKLGGACFLVELPLLT
jgi:signal transduction histidine kinase